MSLWTERDEPVLRWLADHPPDGGILWTFRGSDAPHDGLPFLTHGQVHRAVETLGDAGYLSFDEPKWSSRNRFTMTRFQVTGSGKQALGLWPRFDALGSPGELAEILDALSDIAPTKEQATYLKRAAATVRMSAPGVIRSLAVAGLSAGARSLLGI
jgi:hypothetical protein